MRFWRALIFEAPVFGEETMKAISVAEMRAADRYTIEKGTPSIELMRRAARGVFDAFSSWDEKRTLIVCGSGNNGGDGYALAAILKGKGFDVTVLRASEKFSRDGAFYYSECLQKGVADLLYGRDPVDFGAYDVIVDCMLGTGFSGTPREPIAEIIRQINHVRQQFGVHVISVDINSGMDGDTGEAALAVASDLTVSIGYYKTGFFRGRASELIGALVNADIGIELPPKNLGTGPSGDTDGRNATSNIILIGMPASGKSTAGVILAKLLGYSFLDTDLLIQSRAGRRLREIIADKGVDGFLADEEAACLSVRADRCVIATGGSVVYSEAAMAHLKALGCVVYLEVDYETLLGRLQDIQGRGVVLRPEQTLADLYEERSKLYEKYADLVVSEGGGDLEETVMDVYRQYTQTQH